MRPDPAGTTGWRGRWIARLGAPVDATFLVVFRVAFGLLIALDMLWHVQHGFIRDHFIEPARHFTYFGFGWVRPLPGDWMFLPFAVVGLSGVMIALGWRYRAAAALFFTGFTWIFLTDQSLYLNHNYLICLLGFLLILLPAHVRGSLDALAGRVAASTTVPAWTLWILRFQLTVVYVYGGLAKINPDWLRGEPVRTWLAGRADLPVIGPWLTHEFAPTFFAYGGLLYDLLVVPLLLWRRTRWLAVAMTVFFHLTNATLFDIGIFPWMMLASTFLFFPPEQIARLVSRGRAPVTPAKPERTVVRPALLVALAAYAAVQLLLPLRHWVYPGDVAWTEEGHRFSWRMKLRSKQGWVTYRVVEPATGRTDTVRPEQFMTGWQAVRMATRPDMILQGAHWLAAEQERAGQPRPQVYADAWCVLNGRAPRRLIDPATDLAAQPRSLAPAPWITPFTYTPLRRGTTEVPIIFPPRTVRSWIGTPPFDEAKARADLITRQARQLDRVNEQLLAEFGLDPEGYYLLAGQTLYALTPRPEHPITGAIDPRNLDSLRRHFIMEPRRVLEGDAERTRYEALATRKAVLSERLEVLAAMAPVAARTALDIE
ncbi:MAG TPA: HTTM domain-containing protein [Kiritimatiellia bacterium]|nr:HTTM domain-containing protein [Kiritimatiellia bacterium]